MDIIVAPGMPTVMIEDIRGIMFKDLTGIVTTALIAGHITFLFRRRQGLM